MNNGALRLVCLGCGDAFSARWYSSCLAVGCEDAWLLVDCPHPIRKILRESGGAAGHSFDVDSFDAVLLTHRHADHSSGLEGLGYYSYFHLGRPTRLMIHPDVLAGLWEHQLAATMSAEGSAESRSLAHYFDVQTLSDENTTRLGRFEIDCRRTAHPIPTFALRIRAAGRTLGYSADTSFDPGLIQWLSSSDLIVHETNRGTHTPYEALASLPEALRARMRLIHYPDDFDLEGSVIEPLRQGVSYEV